MKRKILKAVGLAAVITMVFCASAQSAVIASFDVQGTNSGTQPTTQAGYTALTTTSAGLGSATANGITVTITQATGARTRDPVANASGGYFNTLVNPNDPVWDLYRDFSFGALSVTVSGLTASTEYEFVWHHYDALPGISGTTTVYQDVASGTPLFSSSYSVNTDPNTTGNTSFTATSNGDGDIFLVTATDARFNGLDVIPEPATGGMLLLGATAFLGLLRRKLHG